MSPERHGDGIVVTRFELPSGHRFDRHAHTVHQLAWAPRGVVTMRIDQRVWVLPRSRGLWSPAGTTHDVLAGGATTMMGVYFDPCRCPIRWQQATVVNAGG